MFLLGGLSTRWKQTIVNLLTGNSFSALALKEEIIKIIMACKSLGFKIHVVTSDMGGRNLALWKLFSIHAGRHSRPHTSCVHPCESGRKLCFFFADVPLLLKNFGNHLTKGELIYLLDDVVQKNDQENEQS